MAKIGRFLLDHQPPRRPRVPETLTFELFGFLKLDTEVEQAEWRNHTQRKTDTPCRSQVILSRGKDDDHGYESGNDEAKVDLDICKHDEPPISVALFQFAGAFCAGNATGWVLASAGSSRQHRFAVLKPVNACPRGHV